MFELKVYTHISITQSVLNEIVTIKSVAWPFSYEDHLSWIRNNLKEKDSHVVLYQNGIPVAYLNLISIIFDLNKESFESFGVGNVCSLKYGNGWGAELMKQTNNYLIKNHKIGLLFCNKSLIEFYKNYGWILINKKILNLNFENNKIETMAFNVNFEFNKLSYLGNSF